MADIPIIPPNLPQIATPEGAKVISRNSSELAGLLKGDLLNAVVVKQDSSGYTVLNLQGAGLTKSEVAVHSYLPLPKGANLSLKILTNNLGQAQNPAPDGNNFRAQIVFVNGKPPEIPSTGNFLGNNAREAIEQFNILKSSFPLSNSTDSSGNKQIVQVTTPRGQVTVQPGTLAGGAAIISSSGGSIFDAVLISPKEGAEKFFKYQTSPNVPYQNVAAPNRSAGNLSPAGLQLKPSDTVRLHVTSVNIEPKTAGQTQAQPQTPNAALNPNKLAAYKQAEHLGETPKAPTGQPPSALQTPNTSSQPQANVQQQPAQPAATGQSSSAPQTPNTPAQAGAPSGSPQVPQITNNPTFVANVIGTESSGEVVIKTPMGTLKLPAGTNLPQGAELTMEVVKVNPKRQLQEFTSSQIKTSPAVEGRVLTSQDSALAQLATLLKSFDAELGTKTSNLIPQANKQAAAKILWFIVNITGGGDASSWMGPDIKRMLEQYKHTEIISRLDKTFSSLRGIFSENPASGWNNLLFPLYDGEKLNFAGVYIKRDGKKDNKREREKEDVRFVVELELDQMGEMQLDGFVKGSKEPAQFDLFLRSKMELDKDVRNDIIEIFNNSVEITGIQGSLQFQHTNNFPTDHREETNDIGGGIVV